MNLDGKEQVMVFGVKKFNSFTNRETGEVIDGGCTVWYGFPYSDRCDNKLGFDIQKFTFRKTKDDVYDQFDGCNFPVYAILEYHRETAVGNIKVDSIYPAE